MSGYKTHDIPRTKEDVEIERGAGLRQYQEQVTKLNSQVKALEEAIRETGREVIAIEKAKKDALSALQKATADLAVVQSSAHAARKEAADAIKEMQEAAQKAQDQSFADLAQRKEVLDAEESRLRAFRETLDRRDAETKKLKEDAERLKTSALKEVESRETLVAQRQKAVEEKEIEVKSRENAVKGREDFVKLQEELIARKLAELDNRSDAVMKRSIALEEKETQIALKEQEVNRVKALNEKQAKELVTGRNQLDVYRVELDGLNQSLRRMEANLKHREELLNQRIKEGNKS